MTILSTSKASASLALLLLLAICAPAQDRSKPTPTPAPPRAVPAPGAGSEPPACEVEDKVEVTELSTVPAKPVPNQPLTVKLKVKGNCPAGTPPAEVGWEIRVGDEKLGGGRLKVRGDQTVEATAKWEMATEGKHTLSGWLTSAPEEEGAMANNRKSLDLDLQVRLVGRTLNNKRAMEAGAVIRVQKHINPPCTFTDNFNDDSLTEFLFWKADCERTVAPGQYSVTPSITASFEIYKDFTLKNGWKFVAWEILGCGDVPRTNVPMSGGENLDRSYQLGNSTITNFRTNLIATYSNVDTCKIKFHIMGPEGTDPYQ